MDIQKIKSTMFQSWTFAFGKLAKRQSILLAAVIALQFSVNMTASAGVSAETFKNPPNEFRLIQYQLTHKSLKEYPQWGIGGYMGFFYGERASCASPSARTRPGRAPGFSLL